MLQGTFQEATCNETARGVKSAPSARSASQGSDPSPARARAHGWAQAHARAHTRPCSSSLLASEAGYTSENWVFSYQTNSSLAPTI